MCKKDRLIIQLRKDYNTMYARRHLAEGEVRRLTAVVSELQEKLEAQEAIIQPAFWFFCHTNETEESKRKALHDAVKKWFEGVKS